MIKRIAILMLSVVLFLGMTACGDYDEYVDEVETSVDDGYYPAEEETYISEEVSDFPEEKSYTAEEEPEPDEDKPSSTAEVPSWLEVNDEGYVVFGMYEQDGDESNGPEPIEWQILSDEGDSLLLLSRYVLDDTIYGYWATEITWETSNMRQWLNDDFYNNAFSDDEKELIPTVLLSNPTIHGMTSSGNDTEDKIFCLSAEEIAEFFPFTYTIWSYDDEDTMLDGYCPDLLAEATPYANRDYITRTILDFDYYEGMAGPPLQKAGFSPDVIDKTFCAWWTRTAGIEGTNTAYVRYDGDLNLYGDYNGEHRMVGVRPAMYIMK